PQHEIGPGEVDVREPPRAVLGEIEPELAGDLDRLRQRRPAAEVERAQRGDPHRQAVRLPLQKRGCERAPEPVAGADEGDAERALLGAQRTCPSSKPTASSIRSCRERSTGPASQGAARSARDFQTSLGSLGASEAAARYRAAASR